ncbi:DUF4153 domain-containing protein [Thalassotalea maritima]|uniref:DUF4153 domain-containing protein n=1 Tax=Thalassotalea maritima TaxID=3242416 RepID=UPI0035279CA9
MGQFPKGVVLILATVQGVLLTLLYRAVELKVWPSTEPAWLVALVTLVISLPLLVFFCIDKDNVKQTLRYVLPFSVLLSLIGAYIGWQQEPVALVHNGNVIAVFVLTSLIASFKALMYLQQYMSQQQISYGQLFTLSWRNFIIFTESVLFVAVFWGILLLGAGLFAIVGIDIFKSLLTKDWFVIPTLTLAFAFANIIFRSIVTSADTIAAIVETLLKFLLPALAFISLAFLFTLPFTGLAPLWNTGSGSLLIMWLQALTLFFVNAVYQGNDEHQPYPIFLHRLVFVSVAVLPIYSIVAAYGLWLRVSQYGLTVDRCWAWLIWALLAMFSFAYLIGIVKKRDAWLGMSSKVNVVMGLVVLLVMLLVNTPLMNFQSWSVASQLNRLEQGKVSYQDFDYQYVGRSLGRQGYVAMQALKTTLVDKAPDKVVIIERMYVNQRQQEAFSQQEFLQHVTFWPNKTAFPEALISTVYDKTITHSWSTYRGHNYYFIAQDLNGDDAPEYVVIDEVNDVTSANLWRLDNDAWQPFYMNTSNPEQIRYLKGVVTNGDIAVVKPKWHDLQVGSVLFKVRQ